MQCIILLSANADIAEYHSLDGMNNRNFSFSQFWGLAVQDQGANRVGLG